MVEHFNALLHNPYFKSLDLMFNFVSVRATFYRLGQISKPAYQKHNVGQLGALFLVRKHATQTTICTLYFTSFSASLIVVPDEDKM
jgi:hypothetical protein